MGTGDPGGTPKGHPGCRGHPYLLPPPPVTTDTLRTPPPELLDTVGVWGAPPPGKTGDPPQDSEDNAGDL